MKIFHLALLGSTLIFSTGCYDINNLPQNLSEQSGAPKTTYPLRRTITDIRGRQINATILGKAGIEIAISKGNDGKKFVIALEQLSRADQDYFASLRDGGNFSSIKRKLEQEAHLEGRIARWHMDITTAEREATKLNLPMLLAVVINSNEESAALEKKLGFSSEFRNWAAKNVVLCMLKLDSPYSNKTSSFSAVEDRNHAAKYGIIEYNAPTIILVKPNQNRKSVLSRISMSNPESAIQTVSSAIDRNLWSAIEPKIAREKERSSIYVIPPAGQTESIPVH